MKVLINKIDSWIKSNLYSIIIYVIILGGLWYFEDLGDVKYNFLVGVSTVGSGFLFVGVFSRLLVPVSEDAKHRIFKK